VDTDWVTTAASVFSAVGTVGAFIAYRGLRHGEASGVQGADVDLDAGYLRITQQVVLIGWETEVGKPKTDGGERTVSLDAGSVQVLRRWRERQDAERAATHGAWQDTGQAIPTRRGSGRRPSSRKRHHRGNDGGLLPAAGFGCRFVSCRVVVTLQVDGTSV
jgi:integrase